MTYTSRYPRAARPAGPLALLLCCAFPLLFSTAQAQHTPMHGGGHGGTMEAMTMPMDDAVLASAPEQLSLEFEEEVRLVKLTLRQPGNPLLDIGFRYDPSTGQQFTHRIPSLDPAEYYIAEWAVIDEQERVYHGRFHFSFGPDARPPSELIEEMEEMRHIMAPDYRLQDPESEFRIR